MTKSHLCCFFLIALASVASAGVSHDVASRMAALEQQVKQLEAALRTSTSDTWAGRSCDDLGGISRGGKCFFVPNGLSGTWSAAESMCQTYGGHLASIRSWEENFDLNIFISDHHLKWPESLRLWIGATDADSEGEWVWTDGSALTWKGWADGEPNNSGGNENCAVMMVDGFSYDWNDQQCDREQAFLCMVTHYQLALPPSPLNSSSCRDLDGRMVGDSCFFAPRDLSGTWAASDEACQAYGGHLSSVADTLENDAVFEVFQSSGASAQPGSTWIGMRDIDSADSSQWALERKQWQWVDGLQARFHRFNQRPDGNGDCVATHGIDVWDNEPCGRTQPFVCKVETRTSAQPALFPCSAVNGRVSGNKCFFRPWHGVSDWQTGSDVCQQYGAHLASISSQNELDFVEIHFYTEEHWDDGLWLGLYAQNRTGDISDFVWSDGSEMDFSKWAPREWPYIGNNQHCGALHDFFDEDEFAWVVAWDDKDCSQTRGFVCSAHISP